MHVFAVLVYYEMQCVLCVCIDVCVSVFAVFVYYALYAVCVCVLCGGSRWSQATGENSCQAAPGTAAQMGMNMRVATRARMVTRMDEERRKIIA